VRLHDGIDGALEHEQPQREQLRKQAGLHLILALTLLESPVELLQNLIQKLMSLEPTFNRQQHDAGLRAKTKHDLDSAMLSRRRPILAKRLALTPCAPTNRAGGLKVAPRLAVWKQQDDSFFDEALIDCDGVYVSTTGECKVGMDVNYKNEWGYHPLLVSLANTQEPLFIVNRKGNRPSEEDAAIWLDKAIAVCRRGGFRRIRLRGDTAFSQTKYLDAWNAQGTLFQFGYDSMANVRELAENLGDSHWKRLQRPDKYTIRTEPRAQPENVKQRIVRERGYENLVLQYEDVGEFEYQPTLCKKSYRMVVVRKLITHERGTELLFPETRYLFYITNDWQQTPSQIVFGCNDRCDQENLNSHLKSGVRCLTAPVDNLESNWAYMVCTSLAWTLKAWAALLLPATQGDDATSAQQTQERRRWLRMEFKTFARAVLQLPCQVVKQAGAVICRVLNWNEHLEAFFRLSDLLTSGELRRQLRANRCQQE
jgi:hypothetical protein